MAGRVEHDGVLVQQLRSDAHAFDTGEGADCLWCYLSPGIPDTIPPVRIDRQIASYSSVSESTHAPVLLLLRTVVADHDDRTRASGTARRYIPFRRECAEQHVDAALSDALNAKQVPDCQRVRQVGAYQALRRAIGDPQGPRTPRLESVARVNQAPAAPAEYQQHHSQQTREQRCPESQRHDERWPCARDRPRKSNRAPTRHDLGSGLPKSPPQLRVCTRRQHVRHTRHVLTRQLPNHLAHPRFGATHSGRRSPDENHRRRVGSA